MGKEFYVLDDFDVYGKRVLVRVDFNSPLDPKTKKIIGDARIKAHLETIRVLSERGAKTIILAHQGRPGSWDFVSLEEHAKILENLLGKPVKYVDDIIGEKAIKSIEELKNGEVLVLDNVRKLPYERKKKTSEEHAKSELVQVLSKHVDCFVLDGFSVAHRPHASVIGFQAVLPSAAGLLLEKELKAMAKAVDNPERPTVYVLGGAKPEDSFKILEYGLKNDKIDHALVGGVINIVFLKAIKGRVNEADEKFLKDKGFVEFVEKARELYEKFSDKIVLSEDLAVDKDGERVEVKVDEVPDEYMIKDIGTETIEEFKKVIKKAKTIVLNGPMGVFEEEKFEKGTKEVFTAIALSDAFSLAGGGHTLSALEEFNLIDKISHVSTAGGAMLAYLAGEKLPGIEALKECYKRLSKS
ncbi:MAG: phosphoglycerate kinase [Candidatus Asgardarchaeia archaeon]